MKYTKNLLVIAFAVLLLIGSAVIPTQAQRRGRVVYRRPIVFRPIYFVQQSLTPDIISVFRVISVIEHKRATVFCRNRRAVSRTIEVFIAFENRILVVFFPIT